MFKCCDELSITLPRPLPLCSHAVFFASLSFRHNYWPPLAFHPPSLWSLCIFFFSYPLNLSFGYVLFFSFLLMTPSYLSYPSSVGFSLQLCQPSLLFSLVPPFNFLSLLPSSSSSTIAFFLSINVYVWFSQ